MTAHPDDCRCLVCELGVTMPHVVAPPTTFGLVLDASEFRPLRDLLAAPETSHAGNVILRVGREFAPGDGGWERVAHVVLEPREAIALATAILDQVSPVRAATS